MNDDALKSIKLVIWDLDDTFWSGTLAEGSATRIQRNVDIVRALLKRGIVCSICSNNDADAASAKLARMGVRDLFVMPQISWEHKGAMVAKIIADCQLRPQNVLFVDDNPRLRAEVMHANPNVSTMDPAALDSFEIGRWQVSDPGLDRLEQYKDIERKRRFQREHALESEEFLRVAEITITIDRSHAAEANRIVELVNRANQLNFTKRQLAREDLAALLGSADHACWSIQVADRFAKYGLCGFACVDLGAGRLMHFVFSCRILNMGVEAFVFAHLGRPALSIVQPVSSNPLEGRTPDWIRLARRLRGPQRTRRRERAVRVLIKGSCDLLAVTDYLKSSRTNVKVDGEFDRRRRDGKVTLLHNHLGVLRLLHDAGKWKLARGIVRMFPWFDASTERTALFSGLHDVYVVSVARDLQSGMYRHKETGLLLPFDDIDVCWTDVKNRGAMLEGCKYRKQHGLSDDFLDWLTLHFDHAGAEDVQSISDNVRWLRSVLPGSSKLLILDAAEALPAHSSFGRKTYVSRAKELNRALREATAALAATAIVEVSRLVRSPDDLVDSPSHYVRHVYHSIANELMSAIGISSAPEGESPAARGGDQVR